MKYVIVFALIVILFNSCCTKKECLNVFDINEIWLINFEAEEMDSIFMKSYVKNSNFTEQIDSADVTSIRELNDLGDFMLLIPISFDAEKDYQIEFRQLGFVASITNIEVGSEKCNNCFLTKDNYSILESYEVNGMLQNKKYIEIIK